MKICTLNWETRRFGYPWSLNTPSDTILDSDENFKNKTYESYFNITYAASIGYSPGDKKKKKQATDGL